MTNPWIGGVVKSSLQSATAKFIKGIFTKCSNLTSTISPPIKMEKPIYGSFNRAFIHHALPGLLCSFCFYLPMMFTLSSIMNERNMGLLDRSLMCGMRIPEVIGSHLVIQAILAGVQTGVMLFVCYVFYSSPQEGSWIVLLVQVFLIEAMGTSYGLLLAVCFDSERLATYAGVGTIVGLLGILGVIWPFEGMHRIIRESFWAIPVLPGLEGYRSVAQKGWPASHPAVARGLLQSLAWTTIFALISTAVISYRRLGA